MNKMLKTVPAVAMLSMPAITYGIPAFSDGASVAPGNGGNDGRTVVIGLAILTFLAVLFGSDGGSIGGSPCSGSAGADSAGNCTNN